MGSKFISAAEEWLERHTGMEAAERKALAAIAPDLVASLPGKRPVLLGLAGAPGTGKSTLAGLLSAVLAADERNTMVLSLDDYYLPSSYRQALAHEIHPLFAVRGVPGTHDLDLLLAHLDAITAGAISVYLPRFDKSSDDRAGEPETVRVPAPLHCLIIEGWCVGVPPQDNQELRLAVNSLEDTQDRDRAWRLAVNDQVRRYHNLLSPRLDACWLLGAPDWECVLDWRWRQEQDLPPERRLLGSHGQVREFLANYERLCRHMLDTKDEWADLVIELSPEHIPQPLSQS